eukprot:TRINITY_DN36486_c0_g1_i1.p1 TRINITY_DN36486_c0_g1~~TRINITY_DN36486_c0_g1_i1.p1  ORF type:complete len:849 (-),score=101.77 TRINITY_DN36486_c0_g1_i1:164-2710(-)
MHRMIGAAQEAAILAFFRVVADHEVAAESLRCRLCELQDFDPYDAFKSLQGKWQTQKGWISATDLRRWLSDQPHHIATAPLEEIAAMLTPFVSSKAELRYEGFLRLTLPKESVNAWLKEVCLARGSQASHERETCMRPEMAHRLCQLFENEMDMNRHLRFHRKRFQELGVFKDMILNLLEDDHDVYSPGITGLISPAGIRRVLADKMQALTIAQCDALLRRINPSGVCLVGLSDLSMLLSPPVPYIAPFSTSSFVDTRGREQYSLRDRDASRERDSYLSGRKHESRELREREASREREAFYHSRDREPSRELDTYFAAREREAREARERDAVLDHRRIHGVGLSRAPPPLHEPTNGRPLGAPLSPRSPRSPRHGSRPLSPVPVRNSFVSFASPEQTTPLPPFSWKDARYDGVNGSAACRGGSLTNRSRFVEDSRARDPSPSRYGSLTARGRGLSNSRDSSIPRKASLSAERKYMNSTQSTQASTQASTLDLGSPRSPRGMLAHAGAHRGHAPAEPIEDPGWIKRRAGSMPAGSRDGPIAAPFASPAKSPQYHSTWSDTRASLATAVLRVMASQAETDLRTEDAKAVLPPTCTLEAIFAYLDRHRKGYVTDTDLWQLSQDFRSNTSFSSLVMLLNEIQLRHPRSKAYIPGRLSMREIAMLVLPVNSHEFKIVQGAACDDEAKTELYLMRNSEACPTCGIRVQRSGDCAGCPNVRCVACGTSFRCFCVVSDYAPSSTVNADGPLSLTLRYQLHQLVDSSARAAEDLERERRRLSATVGFDLTALSDVFSRLTNGNPCMRRTELRLALSDIGLHLSEQELDLLWRRYAPHGGFEVSFSEFARQLKPRLERY